MGVQIDSANGYINLTAEDGAGGVELVIPRSGFAKVPGYGLFRKATPRTRLFQSPTANTITTTQQIYVEVGFVGI